MSDINIEELVYEVLENLKKRITNLEKIDINNDTVLLGTKGVIDSITFVDFIIALETRIQKDLGINFEIPEEEIASSPENSPFSTVQATMDYVKSLVAEKQSA